MPKAAVFTMKLEAELRTAFLAEAAKEDRPASQVMRELMRSYIQQRRQDREYGDYLQRKIDISRASLQAGSGQAYLFGLGVTDSPASLGTDVLAFAAGNPTANPFASRKQAPDNLFSEAVEVEIEFEAVTDTGPSLLDRIKGMFTSQRKDDAARFADVHAAVEAVATVAAAANAACEDNATALADLTQQFSTLREATRAELATFAARLDTTPADTF